MNYFVLKYHKCPVPGQGKFLVLPIGADAHVFGYDIPVQFQRT